MNDSVSVEDIWVQMNPKGEDDPRGQLRVLVKLEGEESYREVFKEELTGQIVSHAVAASSIENSPTVYC